MSHSLYLDLGHEIGKLLELLLEFRNAMSRAVSEPNSDELGRTLIELEQNLNEPNNVR